MYNTFFPSLKISITEKEYPELFYFLKYLKELSSSLFDCDFKYDICKRYSLYGCCSTCMKTYGFYKYDSFILGTKDEIISYFSFHRNENKYGFLNLTGENKGCSLPRYLRSNPCNIFKCYDQHEVELKKRALRYDELISQINKYFIVDENCNKKEKEIISELKEQNKDFLNYFNI